MRAREIGSARGPRATAPLAAVHLAAGILACGGDGGRAPGRSSAEPSRRVAPPAAPSATADRPIADIVRRVEDPDARWRGEVRLVPTREHSGGGASESGEGQRRRPELTGIRDVAASSRGRLLVLDGREVRVAVLDSAGRLERYLGRRGQGPGELRTPDRVEAAPGGGAVVLERRPPFVHRWDDDGRHVATGRLLSARSSGRAVGEEPSTSPVTEVADWGPELGGGRAVRLVRLDPRDPSGSRSAVYVADTAGRIGTPVVSWTTPGTRSGLPEAFGARRTWTAGRAAGGEARIVVARGARYEIAVHDGAGRLRTVIRRDVPPRPVTRELRERALDRFVAEASRAGAPPSVARDLRDRLPVADALPVVGGLWHSAPDGRLWVGLVGAGDRRGPVTEVRAYDVYELDEGGRYLGQVPAPAGFRLHRVRGNLLYGSWLDSLDVPGVRVYRLMEPPGSGG